MSQRDTVLQLFYALIEYGTLYRKNWVSAMRVNIQVLAENMKYRELVTVCEYLHETWSVLSLFMSIEWFSYQPFAAINESLPHIAFKTRNCMI